MGILKKTFTSFITAVLLLLAIPFNAFAVSSTPVQFTIPDTTLTINGYAAPGALVSIYDDDALIGTVVAQNDGTFSKTFPAQEKGLHNIKLNFVDKFGIVSDTVSDTVSVKVQQDTALEYFLPPTIKIIPKSLTEGGLVTFRGSTIPGARVEISVDGGNYTLRPLAGPDGLYNVSLGTKGFYFGNHPVTAKSSSATLTSFQTNEKVFEVLPSPVEEQIDTGNDEQLNPPKITKPSSPQYVSEINNLIQGVGPPNTQIIIYVDGQPIGSTFTNSEGVWYFNITMTDTEHFITTSSCVGNFCSDPSNELHLIFEGEFNACANFELNLQNYRFFGINPGDGIDLDFEGLNGIPTYEMIVDWGDTNVEKFNHSDQDGFKIHHVYQDIGQFNGVVTIQDDRGCSFTRYFSVDVQEKEFNNALILWSIPLTLGGILIYIFRDSERRRYQRLLEVQEHYEEDLDDFTPRSRHAH